MGKASNATGRKVAIYLFDQLEASVVGGRVAGCGGSIRDRKGVCKDLLQVVSGTSQVVVSRRVHRYTFALKDTHQKSTGGQGKRREE